MDSQPYVGGYVYSNGQLAAGASCVAPVLEIANRLPDTLTVSWMNRTFFGDDFLSTEQPLPDHYFANRVEVAAQQIALVTNFFPSSGFYRSLLRLESPSSGVDLFLFNFSAEAGYYFARVTALCPGVCCPFSSGPSLASSTVAFAKHLAQTAAYAPTFAGNLKPRWKDCVIFPITVQVAPRPDRAPVGSSPPCLVPPSV